MNLKVKNLLAKDFEVRNLQICAHRDLELRDHHFSVCTDLANLSDLETTSWDYSLPTLITTAMDEEDEKTTNRRMKITISESFALTFFGKISKSNFDVGKIEKYVTVRDVEELFVNRADSMYIESASVEQMEFVKEKLYEFVNGDYCMTWMTENPGTQLTSSFNPIFERLEEWYGEYLPRSNKNLRLNCKFCELYKENLEYKYYVSFKNGYVEYLFW